MKKQLFIHVGMPKCGSSAIQSLLSSHDFCQTNDDIVYISIDRFGSLIYGDKLVHQATKSIFNYSASVDISHLLNLEEEIQQDIINNLELLSKDYKTIVLSNEGWGLRPYEVDKFFKNIFDNTLFEVNIIGFIRPQVEWINSAWWQWGVWTEHSIDYWLEHVIKEASWFKYIEVWNSLNWVANVHFSLLDSSMIKNFLSKIGAKEHNGTLISNQSSSELLLRFFQLNREFRESSHDSGKEFALNRWLSFENKSTPFVIEKRYIEMIQTFHEKSNRQLIKYLTDEDKKKFLQETSKWFLPLLYEKKNIVQSSSRELDSFEYETLLKVSQNAIDNLKHKYLEYDFEALYCHIKEEIEINNKIVRNFKIILILDEYIRTHSDK
ncbi:MAG TPA: hypothetical protein ENK66_06665 [Arcobacter sp.]|nr:hypothetical protein [Arcobacter sp.]